MFAEKPRLKLLSLAGALLSGILLTAGYAPVSQAWCGWLALIPVALCLLNPALSRPHAFVTGYVLGLVHFGTVFFWLNEVTTAGWFALTLYQALFPAIWCLLWREMACFPGGVCSSTLNIFRAVMGASGWVVLEWLRGTLFSGFPWNYIAVTQYQVIGVIQIAELGGVLLVSWLVVYAGLSIGLTAARLAVELKNNPVLKNRWEFTLAMALAGLSFAYGIKVVFEKRDYPVTLRYLAVQPNLPQNPWGGGISLREAVAKMEVLSVSGLTGCKTDLVVWPETPVPEEIYSDRGFSELQKTLTVDRDCAWLLGSIYYEDEKAYNSALLFNAGGPAPQIYRKNHLVIFGEYTPLADLFPIIRKLTPLGMDFSAGGKLTLLHLKRPDLKMAPLICFEDTLPVLARTFARQEPDLFINMTNDGWFRKSAESRQHLANAVFRCIENRKPMLRVTNSGVTAVISEYGIVGDMLKDPETGSTYVSGSKNGVVHIPASRVTFYNQHGDWIVALSSIVLLAGLGWSLRVQAGLRKRAGLSA